MKIGIITFHYNNNFGAALQCYALQKVLKELGHEVEIIDYIPKDGERLPFWKGWNIRGGGFRKKAAQRFMQLRYESLASKAFHAFRDRSWVQSSRCNSQESFQKMASNYDAVICGSDQVWVFERPTPYFLDLGDEYSGLRISYAACCGHDRQRPEMEENVIPLLKQMNSISVRNSFSKEIIERVSRRETTVVADPTVLVDFDQIERKYPLPYNQYILFYSLSADDDKRQAKIVKKIREKTGNLPVVSVVANSCPRKSAVADLHIFDADPGQWVWLFKNASFVYTDSFHGVLFCVKYGRPFLADYKEKWRSLRLLDIAQRYRFMPRVIEAGSEYDVDLTSTYSRSLEYMNNHAKESVDFLKDALAE